MGLQQLKFQAILNPYHSTMCLRIFVVMLLMKNCYTKMICNICLLYKQLFLLFVHEETLNHLLLRVNIYRLEAYFHVYYYYYYYYIVLLLVYVVDVFMLIISLVRFMFVYSWLRSHWAMILNKRKHFLGYKYVVILSCASRI